MIHQKHLHNRNMYWDVCVPQLPSTSVMHITIWSNFIEMMEVGKEPI